MMASLSVADFLKLGSHADLDPPRSRRVQKVRGVRHSALWCKAHEVVRCKGRDGQPPVRVVEDVGRLETELRPPTADLERLEQRQVDVPDGGTAEPVAAARTETFGAETGRLREDVEGIVRLGRRTHGTGRL